MVLIHIQRSTEEFIYETKCTTSVDVITREIAELNNLRLRVKRLAAGMRDLANYGPMRPESERGLTPSQLAASSAEEAKAGEDPSADPLGMRVGQAPPQSLQQTLNQCAQEAEDAVSNAHAKLRRPLSLALIHEKVQNCKGAVMMAYPQGLPEWEVVRHALDDSEDLSGQEDSKHVLDPSSAALWFAGKQLDRDQPLSKYTGANEKVTIKARIEPKGGHAPQREPAVDEETRRKMMSYWHKKEAEQQRLEADDEESYLNSAWANPRGFKQSAMGIGEIRFKPGR